jgi:CheY-like chemotaxis protein
VVEPLIDFVAASLMKVRFWVILCPINFVGKIKDRIGDMAKEFAAQDGMEELAARASAVVIMSKPVRQGVLFECLSQLHAEGVFRSPTTVSLDMLDAMPRLKLQRRSPSATEYSLVSERRHSLRVLLVDDNSASQQAMRRIIIGAGMLCDVAGNGKEALAAIERATYHVVLMDLVMPELDGATATRFLRQHEAEQGWRRLPVIGISATPSDKAACIAAGMDAWQGLTLGHFSAHPVPFLSAETTRYIPQKVLTLS